jgi:hypothetical protein
VIVAAVALAAACAALLLIIHRQGVLLRRAWARENLLRRDARGGAGAAPARLQGAAAVTPWRPIETAPKGEIFDVWRDGVRFTDCELSPGGYVIQKHSYPVITTVFRPQPTHWMPRPADPDEDGR